MGVLLHVQLSRVTAQAGAGIAPPHLNMSMWADGEKTYNLFTLKLPRTSSRPSPDHQNDRCVCQIKPIWAINISGKQGQQSRDCYNLRISCESTYKRELLSICDQPWLLHACGKSVYLYRVPSQMVA